MMNTFKQLCWALVLTLSAAGIAAASEGEDMRMESVQMDRLDNASLQRGAATFVNYCLNCHSAQYMRFSRLKDIGLTEEQIKNNLIFTGAKLGDTMSISLGKADAKAWLGAAPPDLTDEARIRGRNWLYGYLRSFYRDDASRTGWNNLVFPNVSMPHVLWRLQGTQKLVETEYPNEEQAEAAAVKTGDLVEVELRHVADKNGKEIEQYVVKSLQIESPGTLSPDRYKATVADLVNYLEFMAEPAKNSRIRIGIMTLIFLGVLFVFAYMLKQEYWKDIH
jgi:ubiquinol-cytochrome c reductase cytochrome c1 subunit